MNWRGIKAVMFKDLRVVYRSKMVMLPLLIVPVILQVLMPAAFGLAAIFAGDAFARETGDFAQMLTAMPGPLADRLASLPPDQLMLTLTLVYMFAPLFLIVPLMVSSVIAADSFVGERERKTLEALLYAPLSDRDLLVAKMLGAWVAATGVGLAAFALYALVVNGVGWPVMGRVFFPNLAWVILVLWVAPAVAGLGLGATVIISTRVGTFQEAYQLGGIVVVPIVGLILGQLAGVFYFGPALTFGLGLVVWGIDAVVLWIGVRTFDRDALLARL
jgi:ABC-2 type transport system permease protein